MSQPGWGGRARALLRSYWTPAGRRALGNLVGLVACTVVSQVLGFWGLILLTNGLGPEGYGAVALAATVQFYLGALGCFGLGPLVVRDLALRPADRDGTITCFLGITSAVATVSGVAVAVAAWLVPLNAGERVYLTVVGLCNAATCLNFTPLYDAAHRQALGTALLVPLDVANLVALLAMRSAGALTVENVAGLYAAKTVLATLIPALVYHARVGRIRWRWDGRRARELLRGGWPSMLAMVVVMVPFHTGVVLARAWRGEHDTGVYGLAVAITSAYLAVGTLAVRVVQPHISGPYGTHRSFVRKLVAFGGLFLAGLWAAAGAASYVLIYYFLDPAYRPALVPTLVLLAAAALLLTAMFGNCYLFLFHRERLLMWLYAGTSALYLAAAMVCLVAGVTTAVARSWPGDRRGESPEAPGT